MKNKFFITTAIDYINAQPHIGHAYEKVAADVLARFKAQELKRENVRLLTGTDEHGEKIANAAGAAGIPVEEFAKITSEKFLEAWKLLNIDFDRFIRTTDADHIETVKEILNALKKNGYVYSDFYEGYYCVSCEAYYTETEAPGHICPIHKTPLEFLQEVNWFLKAEEIIKKFGLREKIESDKLEIWPLSAKNEIVSWLNKGFKDVAISRPDVKWGIKVPWDEAHTVYVWVDALINYVTGAKEQNKDWWPADVHVIGKDIAKFHCIIWPVILLGAGLPLPKKVLVHGYLTIDGQKISKSLGNGIAPAEWVNKYGADAVRYFLMREVAYGHDGDVSEAKLRARYEGELANGLGNLVSRITTLIEKNLDGVLPEGPHKDLDFEPDDPQYLIEQYKFHEALAKVFEWVALGNKTVDERKLWDLAKTDKAAFTDSCKAIMRMLSYIATRLIPFMPETGYKILNITQSAKITKAEPLFPKIP